MAIGERLRQLREGLQPKVSQETLGARLGRNQRWVSYRERGQVETSVEEAEEIVRALGFAGAFVIGPESGAIDRLSGADPRDVELAVRLVAVLPELTVEQRDMVVGIVSLIEEQASRRAG